MHLFARYYSNHDYRFDIKANDYAQIEYTLKSKRWILPNYLYELDILLNSELLIKSIIIDTQKICDEGTENERQEYLDKVIRKIEENSNTSAYYYLVLGHYPFWSIGELGPKECMINKLRPTLHKFKVDGYFSGHDHSLQHFRDNYLDHKVDYLISGATNFVMDRPLNKDKVDPSITKFFSESKQNQTLNCLECSGALVLAKADKNQMILKFIDTEENDLYILSINSRRRVSNKVNSYKENLFFLYLVNCLLIIMLLFAY
ncbi:unnamed protein product [Brachionus calyciflorus]|uniref:Tartrate-resistant acid phosphatase type 5 n=1 Tax=Brachionus calyciflorus TaxID=104777 RepID=A0A814SAD5_9BILA|nr:unnamed protein product [Brachionus calyciflorus]